jgi:hypothetical protein
MTWNLEDNSDNPDELKIYKYVLKQSKNPKFAKTVTRFLNLYEYIKLKKFKSVKELQENILSNGKPLFTDQEAKKIFDMSVMRGGESKYPVLNNVFRQFLGWIYQWQPDTLKDFIDNVTDLKERFQIFKHIREDYELGELYGIVLDSITEIIPMNVTIIENIANELPVVGPASGLIATMISSVFMVFNNMIHFSQGDDGAIIVDSFLMIPFIGTSLHSAAISAEKQLGNIAEKRQKLIDTVRRSFGEEEGELIAQYIPDLDKLDSFQLPSMESLQTSALSLAEKRGLPTSIDALQDMAEQRGVPTSIDAVKDIAQQKIDTVNSLGTSLPKSITNTISSADAIRRFGAKRLTSSRPHKKKWGTLKKLKQ